MTKSLMSSRDAIGLVYQSYIRAKPYIGKKRDREIRHPEWTHRLLTHFGRPDQETYNVSVTGSKGKGSHSILLAGMLQKLGLRVGLFTGPHLVDFMERFRVDGEPMPEPKFIDYIQNVHRVVDSFHLPEHQYVGPVGILAVIASLWFRDCNTDVNIFECGRGAKHDDVNQVEHQGAVISPVFLEHARELGPTLHDVAEEKAGIVTNRTHWVVCNYQCDEVLRVLEGQAHEVGSTVDLFGRDFRNTVELGQMRKTLTTEDHIRAKIEDWKPELWLADNGDYVTENAVVAMRAAKQVCKDLGVVDFPDVIDLRDIRLPGRLDVVSADPLMIVDGTIHAESARYIRRWAEQQIRTERVRRFGAILGLPSDKDSMGVLLQLKGLVDFVVITRAHNPHLVFDSSLEQAASEMFSRAVSAPFIEDALVNYSHWFEPNTGVLMLGTQSFVGDVLRFFDKDTTSIWYS